jgi:hypothetical protein
MPEQRTADGTQLRERIVHYLRESRLAERHARVVPLTGDASDRKYFRIIPSDDVSIVLALHAGSIDFGALLSRMSRSSCSGFRCRSRTFLAIPMRSASSRFRISAT